MEDDEDQTDSNALNDEVELALRRISRSEVKVDMFVDQEGVTTVTTEVSKQELSTQIKPKPAKVKPVPIVVPPGELRPSIESKDCKKCGYFRNCDSPFQKGSFVVDGKIRRGVPDFIPEGDWIVVLGDSPSEEFDTSGKVSASSEFVAVMEAFLDEDQIDRLFYMPSMLCRPYDEAEGQPDGRVAAKPGKPALKRCWEKWIKPIVDSLKPKAIIAMGPAATHATIKRLDYFALTGRAFRYGDDGTPVYAAWHYDHTGIDPKKLLPRLSKQLRDIIVSVDTMKLAKIEEVANQDYTLGITARKVADWFQRVYDHPTLKPLGWDVETTGLDIYRTGFKIGVFSFDHPANQGNPLIVLTEYTFAERIYRRECPDAKIPWDQQKLKIEAILKQVMEDPEIPKIGHNLQFDECAVRSYYKWDVKGFYADTMLLNYLLNPDEKGFGGLESLVRRYLPDIPEYWILLDQYKAEYERIHKRPHSGNYLEIPEEVLLPYAAFDTVVVTKLYGKIISLFREHARQQDRGGYFVLNRDSENGPVWPTFSLRDYAIKCRSVHHKLCSHLEHIGQHVDHALVEQVYNVYDKAREGLIAQLEKDPLLIEFEANHLRALVSKSSDQAKALRRGEEIHINWASGTQSRGFFIDFLKLPILKRTEKGGVCLDESVIEEYANSEWYVDQDGQKVRKPVMGQEPWVCTAAKHLAAWRKDEKFISSFLDPIRSGDVVHSDRLLHVKFRSGSVATGRLAAQAPNVQAIPRDGLVKKLYSSRYPNGWMLTRDYSGLEVRVLALFCRDPLLVETFRTGGDVHFNTQLHFFGTAADKKNKTQRSICKQALFGNIFGQGDKGLFELLTAARTISPATGKPVTMEECKKFNQMIYERYPKVGEWVQFAHFAGIQEKWISSAFGFTRGLPEFDSYGAYEDAQRQYSWEERRSNKFLSQLGAMVSGAKRRAQNTPIQSTAADITTFAAWRTNEVMVERGLDSRVVSVIHDDIWVDVPDKSEMVEANRILAYTMDNFKDWIGDMLDGYDASWIDIPIIGECEIGLNPKDALGTLEEPRWDGTGRLVLKGGENPDKTPIRLDWENDYDQIREICFLKKLVLKA